MKNNRNTRVDNYITNVISYLQETWKNKLVSLVLVICGLGIYKMEPGLDGIAFLVITLIMAIPLFILSEDIMINEGF